MATSTPVSAMKGSVLGVILHDVCEEIRLEQLRDILGARRVEPSFKHATPDYVRFENPPVVERLECVVLTTSEKLIRKSSITIMASSAYCLSWDSRLTGRPWCSWRLAGSRTPNSSVRHSRSFVAGSIASRPHWCALIVNGLAKTITFSP